MKKMICISLVLLLVCSLFCGCGAKSAERDFATNEMMVAPEEGFAYTDALYGDIVLDNGYDPEKAPEVGKTDNSVAANRKLIRRLSLSVETENYTELLSKIDAQVRVCGGYVENMEASTRYSSTTRYASLTIRVPVDQLDSFAGYVGEVSNVVYRTESNEDITTTYVDTKSRRDALQIEHDRLLELLEKAENLSEVLEIESRLTDVRYQLQSIESQLRTYDNLVDYSTVTLTINEVKVYTDTEEKGFWEELGDGFVDSLEGVWNFLKNAFSFCIIAIPYLLLISIVPVIVLVIILISCKKRRARKARDSKEEE